MIRYRKLVAWVVKDPEKAERLMPRGYPIGCKRPVVDTGYFETFNRGNVDIIDLRLEKEGGIQRTFCFFFCFRLGFCFVFLFL
eukprot:COSAG05_NODE_2645_length_2807_cov_1752.380724_2_plen_83_part_00